MARPVCIRTSAVPRRSGRTLGDVNRVNTARRRLIVGALLFLPMGTWAHALSPTYFPLGHLPVYLAADSWPFVALIPLTVAVVGVVQWAWIREIGLPGSLWRATILYLIARAAEAFAIFLLQSIPLFQRAGWSSSAAESFGPLALFLLAGLAAAVPIGLLLYRKAPAKKGRVALAVCTASLAGYVAALGLSLVLMMTRG